MVSCYLALGWLRQVDGGLKYENSVKEAVEVMGSGFGLVGLYLQSMLPGDGHGCAVSRTWLILGGAIRPGLARSQILKHRTKKRKHIAIHTDCLKTSGEPILVHGL